MARARTTRKGAAARTGRPAGAAAALEHIPRWVVPLVFGAAVLVLFREFFVGRALLLGLDTYELSFFARDFYTDFVRETHRFPLWQPLLFGGMPFVDGMHGDIFYPPSLAMFFLDARTMWGWKMVLHIFLAGTFAYLWLRSIGLRRGPALFGGLVFMMGPDLVSLLYPGGDGKLFVSTLAPLVFWLAERAVQGRRAGDFALFALGIALVVFTSHMQAAYFIVWGVSLYFFFRTWQVWNEEKNARVAGGLAGAFVLAGIMGVAAAAVQVLPPLGYLREWSHRTERTVQAQAESAYEYSTSYSINAEETVSLVVPEFVGDNAPSSLSPEHTYWGINPLKYNHEYAGLVPLLLLLPLLLYRRTATTWFFVSLAVLALLYALGASTPVFRLFYLIPGVSLFRSPSIIIFLYGLAVATLGALGLQRLLDLTARPEDGPGRTIRIALWSTAAVLALLALAESAGAVTNFWQVMFELDAFRISTLDANLDNIRNGFWIATFIAIAVAGIWELLSRGAVSPRVALVLFLVLSALDLYRVDRRFIRATVEYGEAAVRSRATLFDSDPSIEYLQRAQAAGEVFRVFDLGSILRNGTPYRSNDFAVHGLEQMAGHHGNEIGRYRQLLGGERPVNAVMPDTVLKLNPRLFDLTNTAYVVVPGRLQQDPQLEEAFVGDRSVVYRRTGALARAFLVGRTEVASEDAAVARLLDPTFDPRTTVLLAEPMPAGVQIEPDPIGTVEWIERDVDALALRVTTDRPALLVVSDNYYPAWQADVDGTSVPILRANHTFRAVPVPQGTHEVRFLYSGGTLRAPAIASAGILGLLLLVGLWSLRPARKSRAG
jgi:hypothetical protein